MIYKQSKVRSVSIQTSKQNYMMSSTIFNLKYKKIVPALPGIVLTIIESIMSDIAMQL